MTKDRPASTTARRGPAPRVSFLGLCVLAGLALFYARFIEPTWLSVQRISLSASPTATLVHISDIHYKGDDEYLQEVVDIINSIDADFVVITGDLIEEKRYLPECLSLLSRLDKPLYGVPGNHDHWAKVRPEELRGVFTASGGAWLSEGETARRGDILFVGEHIPPSALAKAAASPGVKKVLLTHYPSTVVGLPPHSYDLILAGHTHGGQIRIPFVGNPILRGADASYLRGLFQTEAGPLHVSAGLGTYFLPMRFRSRPEITIIDL